MDHIDRFYATIERKPVDRPASWLGLPDRSSLAALFSYFRVDTIRQLKAKLDDDIYPVELPYHSPSGNAIYTALDFAVKTRKNAGDRTLTAPGFFENRSDPSTVSDFLWPNPGQYISRDECRQAVDDVPYGYPILGVLWSAHFQDACAAFGMETALIKMMTEPEIFRAVLDRIIVFYLEANEIFYKAVNGRLDAVLLGNDLGGQNGLMVSPAAIREFVLPGISSLVAQAKYYGLKVFYHSCGAISEIIPDLIGIGVDVIHPIQALAKNMNPDQLKRDFGNKVSFCGGIDVQDLLVHGSPAQVIDKVAELKALFPTGLILSPSHEAILPDVPPENIETLFQAIHNQ